LFLPAFAKGTQRRARLSRGAWGKVRKATAGFSAVEKRTGGRSARPPALAAHDRGDWTGGGTIVLSLLQTLIGEGYTVPFRRISPSDAKSDY
jgi:hypothetical protein